MICNNCQMWENHKEDCHFYYEGKSWCTQHTGNPIFPSDDIQKLQRIVEINNREVQKWINHM